MTPEERKEYMKKWRAENKEKIKEQQAIYRENQPLDKKQFRNAYYKKWYAEKGRKRPDGSMTEAPDKRKYSSYELDKMSIHRVENFGKGKLDTGERILKEII